MNQIELQMAIEKALAPIPVAVAKATGEVVKAVTAAAVAPKPTPKPATIQVTIRGDVAHFQKGSTAGYSKADKLDYTTVSRIKVASGGGAPYGFSFANTSTRYIPVTVTESGLGLLGNGQTIALPAF